MSEEQIIPLTPQHFGTQDSHANWTNSVVLYLVWPHVKLSTRYQYRNDTKYYVLYIMHHIAFKTLPLQALVHECTLHSSMQSALLKQTKLIISWKPSLTLPAFCEHCPYLIGLHFLTSHHDATLVCQLKHGSAHPLHPTDLGFILFHWRLRGDVNWTTLVLRLVKPHFKLSTRCHLDDTKYVFLYSYVPVSYPEFALLLVILPAPGSHLIYPLSTRITILLILNSSFPRSSQLQ